MADIVVQKINEVYVRVICEQDSITEEIADFFTFMTPGHEWHPLFRDHKWNGKTYLFNKRTRYLYGGLLRYLITFATKNNYTIEFDNSNLMNAFSLEEAAQFLTTLDIRSKTAVLAPRDYQIVGLAKAIRYKRMLLVSPTASGKSYMIYSICRWLLQEPRKGLIIVPSINLVEQLTTDFIDYAYESWDVTDHVHKIYQGQSKHTDKPIIISTWQSMFKMESEYFEQFDFVIGDEAHLYTAKSLKSILTRTINAEYRIATTGTLDDWKVHKLQIEGLFGPVSKLTTTKRMIDEKQSSDIQIKCLILKHPTHICSIASKWKKKSYQKEKDYLLGSKERNNFIKNLALSLKGNTLLLFQYVDKHGNGLFELIKNATDRNVYYVYGATEVEAREAVRTIVEEETDSIIVASYGVYSTGINIKNLHNIIFASPSKSKIRVLQSIGRGLRLHKDKTHITLYDIADDLRIDGYINYTLKHFAARIKIYKSEEFKVSNYNIDLKEKLNG